MDPERVHYYLQVACAGLGFDIGEVWWTSNQSGVSTVAAIEAKRDQNDPTGSDLVQTGSNRKRFVQLYTSRSYADQRSKLVAPPSEGSSDAGSSGQGSMPLRRRNSAEDLQQHVLSPHLVDAIANTAEVVWANCQKQEGLLGRSDVRLQTAVGMPVAMDENGNMCVVVMFSPNNLQSTDEAMEYLQNISRSATSTSIPCLLPVFDTNQTSGPITKSASDSSIMLRNQRNRVHHHTAEHLGEGVTARFVPLEGGSSNGATHYDSWTGIHTEHNLSEAPKDCFGIPMLPSFAEVGKDNAKTSESKYSNSSDVTLAQGAKSGPSDPFDEASYGVWTTIMDNAIDDFVAGEISGDPLKSSSECSNSSLFDGGVSAEEILLLSSSTEVSNSSRHSAPAVLSATEKVVLAPGKRVRLEEFCSAFLGMSVFDAADVWVPASPDSYDTLTHVTSITANRNNDNLNNFKRVSGFTKIRVWSGAVGRAYGSGNPVWSANQDVIVDSGRATAFRSAKIQTALAVPISSAGNVSPSCVLCCYSLVKTDSVPFVLRFVQQALRLLWEGLDQVKPHESLRTDLWQGVAPADLGEMAADLEMQKAFLSKRKRPHGDIDASTPDLSQANGRPADFTNIRDRSSSLSYQLEALGLPNENYQWRNSVRLESDAVVRSEGNDAASQSNLAVANAFQSDPASVAQYHIQNAVRSVGQAVPISVPVHQHVSTNELGTKRAHIFSSAQPSEFQQVQPQNQGIATQSGIQQVQQYRASDTLGSNAQMQYPAYAANGVMQEAQNQQLPIGYVNRLPLNASQQAGFVANVQQQTININPQESLGVAPYQMQSTAPPASSEIMSNVILPNTSDPTSSSGNSFSANRETSVFPDQVPSLVPPICLPVSSNVAVPNLNATGKVCRIQGCNEFAVSRRPYCLRHCGNRLCEHAGCSKCAQGSTRFCIAHGGGRRCTYPGCDKGARDKFFCAAHGGGKRCKHEGCTKSAVGGSNLCTSHGGGRRCAVEGCDKSAQSSTRFCVKHGGGKKCAHPNCEKVARGRTLYCAAHGGGVRCKLEGCNRVAIGKLQLCRTHGGGSRARPPKTQLSPSTVAIPVASEARATAVQFQV